MYDKIMRRQKIKAVMMKVLLMLFLVIMSIIVGWFLARLGR